jgi:hypothetical protein
VAEPAGVGSRARAALGRSEASAVMRACIAHRYDALPLEVIDDLLAPPPLA